MRAQTHAQAQNFIWDDIAFSLWSRSLSPVTLTSHLLPGLKGMFVIPDCIKQTEELVSTRRVFPSSCMSTWSRDAPWTERFYISFSFPYCYCCVSHRSETWGRGLAKICLLSSRNNEATWSIITTTLCLCKGCYLKHWETKCPVSDRSVTCNFVWRYWEPIRNIQFR
jgi:hypothetical protein